MPGSSVSLKDEGGRGCVGYNAPDCQSQEGPVTSGSLVVHSCWCFAVRCSVKRALNHLPRATVLPESVVVVGAEDAAQEDRLQTEGCRRSGGDGKLGKSVSGLAPMLSESKGSRERPKLTIPAGYRSPRRPSLMLVEHSAVLLAGFADPEELLAPTLASTFHAPLQVQGARAAGD